MKRNDLILLVLLVGCSPHFQSGKTQCSDQGECPSGFICLNDVNDGTATGYLCFDNIPGCAKGNFYCEGLGICKTSLAACSATPGSGGSVSSGGRSGGSGGSGGTGCPAGDYYCAASETCWTVTVVCSTVTNCGTSASPDYRACDTAGYYPDCTGELRFHYQRQLAARGGQEQVAAEDHAVPSTLRVHPLRPMPVAPALPNVVVPSSSPAPPARPAQTCFRARLTAAPPRARVDAFSP